jgi:hypothetical protein
MALNLRFPFRLPANNGTSSPAIWIYPAPGQAKTTLEVEVGLEFHGKGFMTESTPPFNEKWRITVDANAPFYKYSSTYGNDDSVFPYLDYDGFRDGNFQKETGWRIEKEKLIDWQRVHLKELGFLDHEIDDVNYTYARMLLERGYKEKFFFIYPQETSIVDASVGLSVSPMPESVYRLWLYFVPTNSEKDPPQPRLKKVVRSGLSVIELSYLTDREIPHASSHLPHGARGRDESMRVAT